MNIDNVTVGEYSRSRRSGWYVSVISNSSGPVRRLNKSTGTGVERSDFGAYGIQTVVSSSSSQRAVMGVR